MSEKKELQPLGHNQERLLAALESGKYKQGRRVLRNMRDEFCCLGVACDLFGMELIITQSHCIYAGKTETAPKDVVDMLALHGPLGEEVSGDEQGDSLANMNDGGMSFRAIAALVRHNPALFFRHPA